MRHLPLASVLCASLGLAAAWASPLSSRSTGAPLARQGAEEPEPRRELSESYRKLDARNPIVASLGHVHDVLGQVMSCAPAVEFVGPRMNRMQESSLGPLGSVHNGALVRSVGLERLEILSFKGTENPEAEGSIVWLGLRVGVAETLDARVAADLLTLILVADPRVELYAKVVRGETDGIGSAMEMSLGLHVWPSGRLGPPASATPELGLEPSTQANNPKSVLQYLRAMAADPQVALGPLSIAAPKAGDTESATPAKRRYVVSLPRLDGPSARNELQVRNFLGLIGSKSRQVRVVEYSVAVEADGKVTQRITVDS